MSEVSYSNVPPMMAAIKSGDIEAIRSLLHAGHSPNEPQCYQVMIGDWPRDDEASPLELAVLENRMDMVQLLIECGADLTHNPEELLCGSLRSQDLTLFSFLVDVGVRIPATQRDICRLFLHLVDRDEPNVLPILKRMGMDLKQYGGEALRSMASHSRRCRQRGRCRHLSGSGGGNPDWQDRSAAAPPRLHTDERAQPAGCTGAQGAGLHPGGAGPGAEPA